MSKWLLIPPAAFLIILGAVTLFSYLLSKLSFKQNKFVSGSKESYACGEDNYNNAAQPDYSTFFPFAFFFTLAHVATLIMATANLETTKYWQLPLFI
jgi:hypothetical protein